MQLRPESKIETQHAEDVNKNGSNEHENISLESKDIGEQEYFETSKKIGRFYSDFLQELSGGEKEDNDVSEFLNENVKIKPKLIEESVNKHRELNESLVKIKEMKARDILEQAFPRESYDDLLSDTSKYRLERLSNGIFAIIMDVRLHTQFIPSARAVAISVKQGVPFILMREYNDEEVMRREMEENLPHEVHHLVWRFLRDDGLVKSDESDVDFKKAFSMYQNELVARLSSEGFLSAYTHLAMMDPESQLKFKKENPEKQKQIITLQGHLNDILKEINEELKEVEIAKIDLILPVMEATNFPQLEENINKIKDFIKNQPHVKKPKLKDDAGGWGVV